jgi:glycerophosphoryl diester phosphodiesterase
MKTHRIFIATLVSLVNFTAFAAQPFCVAHRSLGYGGMENSLEAFEKASKAGAKAIEFDLLHTKDGKTIVQHDGKFGRVTTGCEKRKITETTLKEIKDHCKLNNGEAIPTLEEALALLSQYDSTLFIEFKDKTITEDDFNIIKSYYSARPEKIMIISFLKNILMEIELKKESDPFYKEVKTLQLKKIGFYANIDNVDGISAKYIDKNHVEELQSMGKLVGVYTKDSEKKIQKYLDKGVDFVTTNNSLLCESLIN